MARKDHGGDDPYLSKCEDFLLHENDIIVMGSDGLFDNIFVTEILDIINKKFNSGQDYHLIP